MPVSKKWQQRLMLLGIFIVAGCALQPAKNSDVDQSVDVSLTLAYSQASECREHLGQSAGDHSEGLDAANIRLLSWNIQKEENSGWNEDLINLSDDRDLVLIQEASLVQGFIGSIVRANHRSFAKGYSTSTLQTGVMTFSSTKPLTHCTFSDQEPLLRTPKATSITEFSLKNSAETLVVVNIHAINFSLGLDAFRQQIMRVENVLSDHQGPIIFSGDFNTWSDGRHSIVQQVISSLGMTELVFEQDNRTRFFGQHLDHIYIRGLRSLKSSTPQVESSDHNPMFATFKI